MPNNLSASEGEGGDLQWTKANAHHRKKKTQNQNSQEEKKKIIIKRKKREEKTENLQESRNECGNVCICLTADLWAGVIDLWRRYAN